MVEVGDGVEDDGNTAVVVVGLGNGLLVDDGVRAERRVGGIVVVKEVEPCVEYGEIMDAGEGVVCQKVGGVCLLVAN